ncbi:MAG: SCO family protein [Deltaproteobacteria bacterium]|nr:SCO family protein [Deltaproteobacteria bacterium]
MTHFNRGLRLVFMALALLVQLAVPLSAVQAEEALPVLDKIGGEFTLPGPKGKPVSRADFKGQVVMLTFGYTYCPDVCPTTLNAMKMLRKKLGADAARFQVLFITLDPERDTPERLERFVAYFGEGILSLHGSLKEIKTVTELYRARFMKQPSPDGKTYFVAHSDFLYLLDTKGRTRSLFHMDSPVDEMARDVRRLLSEG